MFLKCIVPYAVLLFVTASTASPQDRRRVHLDDRNGDGAVTRSEWSGDRRTFEQYDTNRDGVLSGNELPGDFGSSNQGQSRAAAGNLDKDRSGAVEGYEWPYNSEVFRELDTNGDSVLSREELNNMSSATRRRIDRNRNNRIDDDEWSGGFAQYDDLDVNRDGRISEREYFARGGEWQRQRRFNQWDSNGDGVIQANEWKAAPRLFQRLDANRDSRVSREEFMADTERYQPPYDWR